MRTVKGWRHQDSSSWCRREFRVKLCRLKHRLDCLRHYRRRCQDLGYHRCILLSELRSLTGIRGFLECITMPITGGIGGLATSWRRTAIAVSRHRMGGAPAIPILMASSRAHLSRWARCAATPSVAAQPWPTTHRLLLVPSRRCRLAER